MLGDKDGKVDRDFDGETVWWSVDLIVVGTAVRLLLVLRCTLGPGDGCVVDIDVKIGASVGGEGAFVGCLVSCFADFGADTGVDVLGNIGC